MRVAITKILFISSDNSKGVWFETLEPDWHVPI